MGIIKKAASASGPIMRILIGAGAIALLVIGMRSNTEKRPTGVVSRNRTTEPDRLPD